MWKIVIVTFVICGLSIAGYWLIRMDPWLESWNPADVSMKFAMSISEPNTDINSFKSFFSGRIKRNLSDNDFRLLHNNFSETESWQNFFQKIPEKKLNLLPEREMDTGVGGVNVDLLLVPSITGWKIDGLKSVRKNQEERLE